jgi:hypothetical protein
MTFIDDDELFYLRTMQGSLLALRSLREGASWSHANRELDSTFAELNRMSRSPNRFRYPFSSIAIPNFIKALNTGARTETERRIAITAIALARFHLARNTYPPTLAALVNNFLPSVPHDLMSGQALCYRLDASGKPILYSVGSDGEDNGGDPTPARGNQSGLWQGRDAVWPSLAP